MDLDDDCKQDAPGQQVGPHTPEPDAGEQNIETRPTNAAAQPQHVEQNAQHAKSLAGFV